MYLYLLTDGPQSAGTLRSSTSAGSLAPTCTFSFTVTGCTFSFTTYCLIFVRCSGLISTFMPSANAWPDSVIAAAVAPTSRRRFMQHLRSLPALLITRVLTSAFRMEHVQSRLKLIVFVLLAASDSAAC